jgi:hypothetical protein
MAKKKIIVATLGKTKFYFGHHPRSPYCHIGLMDNSDYDGWYGPSNMIKHDNKLYNVGALVLPWAMSPERTEAEIAMLKTFFGINQSDDLNGILNYYKSLCIVTEE